MSHSDLEPIPGLPEPLPRGEHILWQGQPCWRLLGRRALHLRTVAIYFLVLMVAQVLLTSSDAGAPVAQFVVFAVIAWSLLALIAWLSAGATMYTITNERIVMRIGVALPVTLNIPLRRLASAEFCVDRRGRGDISLALAGDDRFAYLLLWPHARPWRLTRPEPTLRAIENVTAVGAILREAMAQHALIQSTAAAGTRPQRSSVGLAAQPARAQ